MSSVKKIIDDWDPIDVLFHAPDDEYHFEIEEIEKLLDMTKDYNEVAKGIYDIFLKSYGNVSFQKTEIECIEISKKLLKIVPK